MAKAGASELIQVYLTGGAMTELDALTDRVNQTLQAIYLAGGKIVEQHIESESSGSSLIVTIVYALPKGIPLVRD